MSTTTRRRRARPGRRAARRLGRRPRLTPRARRRLFAAAIALLVLAGLYVSIVRDLPAFAVETVALSGASSGYEPRLRSELEAATKTMTTLHVDERRLEDVAGRYPAVISLEAQPDFPHGLSIQIAERPPVGLVEGMRGRRVQVAADGSLLEGQPVDRPLPALPGRATSGRRGRREATTAAAKLADGAPRPLAAWLREVRRGREGWVVDLRDGPELRFGSLAAQASKWSSAAAVLRSRAARGAAYIDLRLPDRPAAGGFASAAPASLTAAEDPSSSGLSEPSLNTQSEIEGSSQP